MVVQKIIDVGVIEPNKGTCFIDRKNETTVNDYNSDVCFKEFRYEHAMKQLKDKCLGEQECYFDDIKSLFDLKHCSGEKYEDHDFYIQVSCEKKEQEIEKTHKMLLM